MGTCASTDLYDLCSVKDLKQSFYTLYMNSTEMKNKGSCPSLLLVYVFHKVSYVNTATVHQTRQA